MTGPQLQWKRKIGLVVYSRAKFVESPTVDPATGSRLQQVTVNANEGLDLSEMRIHFRISQADNETPNTAIIRVYNLSDQTARKVVGEFQRVVLQAGYEDGAYGVIFDGTIKSVLRGHESNVSSYVDIFAADGDIAYNNACIATPLAAGSTPQDQVNQVLKAMAPYGVTKGYIPDLPPTAAARGKVMFGLARDHMRRIAQTLQMSWSIQNGQLTMIPLTAYKPGEAVVLTAATGLVGFPQQTPGGIDVTALLNPRITIGSLVQIDNKAINQGFAAVPGKFLFGGGRLEAIPGFNARLGGADGFYKVLVHEFEGDTRGEPWYSYLTCLVVDLSAPAGKQVAPYWAEGPYP